MSYRLTINPALELGDNTISFTFSTFEEMEHGETCMANLLLCLYDMSAMTDYSNVFTQEQFVDGEWEEIEE